MTPAMAHRLVRRTSRDPIGRTRVMPHNRSGLRGTFMLPVCSTSGFGVRDGMRVRRTGVVVDAPPAIGSQMCSGTDCPAQW